MCYLNELSGGVVIVSHALFAIRFGCARVMCVYVCVVANMWFSPFQTFRQLLLKC